MINKNVHFGYKILKQQGQIKKNQKCLLRTIREFSIRKVKCKDKEVRFTLLEAYVG